MAEIDARAPAGRSRAVRRFSGLAVLLVALAGCITDPAGGGGSAATGPAPGGSSSASATAAGPSVSAAFGQTCTDAWRAHGHTSQREAQAFLTRCLADQGVADRRMTRDGVLAVATAAVPAGSPLTALVPADAGAFCPAYATLDPGGRAVFWRELLTAIARPESDFRTTASLWEPGLNQFSIGLLQLSYTDRAYGCDFGNEADIADPDRNMACGARIIARLADRHGMIGGGAGAETRGAAAYWSTLRAASPARAEITRRTTALPVCQGG